MLAQKEGFQVWETEIQREGVSYTVDTLLEAHRLGASRDKLFLLVGADSYATLPQWKDIGKIRSLCRILVVKRPGTNLPTLKEDDLALEVPAHAASSTAIRKALAANETLLGVLPLVKSDLENLTLLSQNPYARKIK
jgi:nicotinate-nucleotide adenylyltransferase